MSIWLPSYKVDFFSVHLFNKAIYLYLSAKVAEGIIFKKSSVPPPNPQSKNKCLVDKIR